MKAKDIKLAVQMALKAHQGKSVDFVSIPTITITGKDKDGIEYSIMLKDVNVKY